MKSVYTMRHFVAIRNSELDHLCVVLGVFRTALRFNDLTRAHRTQKSSLLILSFMKAKGYRQKSAKVHRLQSRRNQAQVSSCLLLVESLGQCLISQQWYVTTPVRCCQLKEAHSSLGIQGFYWGVSHVEYPHV